MKLPAEKKRKKIGGINMGNGIRKGDFVKHKQHSIVNVYGEVLRNGVHKNHWIVRFETDTIEVSEAVLEVLLPTK